MALNNRPWCCPEQRCRVVYQYSDNPDLSRQEAGDSFSCFGEMERPVAFVYDGVPHENNLNSCHYTPLKGLIRWQENRDDWGLLSRMYATALKQLDARALDAEDAEWMDAPLGPPAEQRKAEGQ